MSPLRVFALASRLKRSSIVINEDAVHPARTGCQWARSDAGGNNASLWGLEKVIG